MGFGITFAPLVPPYVLWASLALAVVLVALLAFVRSRGWAVRALALAMMVLALANPSFTREDREPLSSVVAVVIVTLLFAEGRFGAGLALAWVMTFLDTVDGKLARVTVTSTPFGHYFDHSIDSVHPPIWYFAWAWGVRGGVPGIWPLAPLLAAILVAYVAGRLIETTFKHFVGGCSLFTWRPFDSYFRLILARRNPNLLLLTGFYLVEFPAAGLTAVAVWTVVSSVILTIRLLQGVVARVRSGPLHPWLEELGGEARSVPPWARPFVTDLAAVRHLVQ